VSLEGVELNVNGTSFKGVWVAIVLSMATSIGGGIWAASQFFARIDGIEGRLDAIQVPDLTDLTDRISLVEQRLTDQNISGLQGKLSELGTNLEQIMERQKELLDLRDRVEEAEKESEKSAITVQNQAAIVEKYDDEVKSLTREINDLWSAMDALSNPLQ
jgi:predicted nuclease with TOPRIM domain